MNGMDPVARIAVGVGERSTLSLETVPIVFVPGVMGSRLLVPGGNNWDPDTVGDMVGWATSDLETRKRNLSVISRPSLAPMTIFGAGAKADIAADSILLDLATFRGEASTALYARRGWPAVAWGFYGNILRFLETRFNVANQFIGSVDHPVYAFGYDFRQSNVASGAALLAFIAKVLADEGAKQVLVVTHSMGGLVARSALAQNPGVIASIRGVVHCAQPADGAVVAYRRFFTGATSRFDGAEVPSRVLESILGTTPLAYASLLSELPGPMSLLPNECLHLKQNPDDPWLKANIPIELSLIFSLYALPQPPGILLPITIPGDLNPVGGAAAINGALLARILEAQAFHALIRNIAHPRTHVLYSTGRRTDAQVDWSHPHQIKITQSASGDGTVPSSSGACLNLPAGAIQSREEFLGLEHSGVFADEAFNKALQLRILLLLSGAR